MAGTEESVVVTGGGQGVGRAIVEHLLELGRRVVIVELRADGLGWADEHIAVGRIGVVPGDAGADDVARTAAERAAALGRLTGWVNNAAVFPDAWLHEAGGAAVAELVRMNLQPALAGAAAAVAAFRAAGTGGAIVNVSSHQAQRSVRGALPYAVAKAAIEGLTRSLAVDYGPWGIRVNAVALGSIVTGWRGCGSVSPRRCGGPRTRSWPSCIRSGAPERPRRSPGWSRTCCRPTHRSSAER